MSNRTPQGLSPTGPSAHRTGWLCLLSIVTLASAVFWPGLFGDWGRDDFMQLAMARMAGSPWVFFVTDHFPLPHSVFRPMGFASFWLGQALFGSHYTGHAILTLGLYLATLITLFSVLRALDIGALPAALATALVACHPIAIGTALWWSARFDLLAVLFALLAIRLSIGHDRQVGFIGILVVPLLLLAGLLAKEVALAAVPAVLLICQYRAWTGSGRSAHLATITSILAVVVFMVWRSAILGTLGSGITGGETLSNVLFEGTARWLGLAFGYFSFAPRLPGWAAMVLGLSAAGLVIALAAALIKHPETTTTQPDRCAPWLVFSLGLTLLLIPALLQAPIARLNAAPLIAGVTAVEAAMQSRLYYLSLFGLSLMLAAAMQWIGGRFARSSIYAMKTAAAAPAIVALLAFAPVSYQHAASFAKQSRDNAGLAHVIHEAVSSLALPDDHCHVVFHDVEPPPDWSIYVSVDSIVKALHPEPGQVGHCFFHANYPTFYHFLTTASADSDAAPFQPMAVDDQPLARRTIGNLTMVHLSYPESLHELDLSQVINLYVVDGKLRTQEAK